jgi:hypothetical protein
VYEDEADTLTVLVAGQVVCIKTESSNCSSTAAIEKAFGVIFGGARGLQNVFIVNLLKSIWNQIGKVTDTVLRERRLLLTALPTCVQIWDSARA